MKRLMPIAMLLIAVSPFTAAQEVRASVAKRDLVAGELFRITVEAEGTEIGEPVLPEAEGLSISPTPISNITSMQFQIVNGQQSRIARRTWVFQASISSEGATSIPAFKIAIDGTDYETAPIRLSIDKAGPVPSVRPGTRSSARATQQEPRPAPNVQPQQQLTFDDLLFIEADVNKREVYQGEQVVLRLALYELSNMAVIEYRGGRTYPFPTIDGFYKGDIVDESRKETRNGYEYDLKEWTVPLYPTGIGDFYIGSWQWVGYIQAQTDRGPRKMEKNLQTNPIEIKVKPLPDRPPGFSGAVGKFELKSSLLDNDVVQGVPARLVVHIIGQGNPDAIGGPALPELTWAQASDPVTEIEKLDQRSWQQVRKSFTYALTPLEDGTQEVPAISYTYFSPEDERYVTETLPPLTVHVRSSGEGSQMVMAGGSQSLQGSRLQELAEDLNPIITSAGSLRPVSYGGWLGPASVVLPPFLFALFAARSMRLRRFAEDSGYARNYFALANCDKRLDGLAQASDPLEELYLAGTSYIADKLDVNGSGLTSDDARRLLAQAINDEEAVESFVRVLRRCERHRYAGSELQDAEIQALADGLRAASRHVEQLFKDSVK